MDWPMGHQFPFPDFVAEFPEPKHFSVYFSEYGCLLARVLETPSSVTAVFGKDVVLPCGYQATRGETVLQVTWLKRGDGGKSTELAVLNSEHGVHIQDAYAGRVLRQGQGSLVNGSILLKNAVQADEGAYECHLITFPQGNFESRLALKVLGKGP
ncbi:hypothetical protein L345_17232, partial [Ophiophagus hannah]